MARQITVIATLSLIAAFSTKIDFDALPSAAAVFSIYRGGSLEDYSLMLTKSREILANYNRLSTTKKRQVLKSWLVAREKKQMELGKKLVGMGTAGYDSIDLNIWDVSKVDIIFMSEGAPAVFYDSEDVLRLLFNAKKTNSKPFEITDSISDWPKQLTKEIGRTLGGSNIQYLDHYSFEGQKARQAPRLYDWLRAGMHYDQLPALCKKKFD